MDRRTITVLLLALTVLAVAAGACNKAEVTGAGDSGGGTALSDPNAVFQSVRDGVADLTSAAYVADVAITGTPNPSASADATAQLAQDLKIHAEGSFSKTDLAAQSTFDITTGGQTINAELRANDSGVYVGLMGQGYQVPPEQTESFQQYATLAPADIFAKLGIDFDQLQSDRTLVGTETVDGAECYHISAKPDPVQVAQGMIDAINSPELKDEAATAASDLSVDPADAEKLKDAIKEISVDYWVDAETGWVRKADATIKLEAAADDTETGLQSADITIALAMSKFNEPVTVEAPPNPQPFDSLGDALFGGGL